jgi:hypothetical protein
MTVDVMNHCDTCCNILPNLKTAIVLPSSSLLLSSVNVHSAMHDDEKITLKMELTIALLCVNE